MARSRSVRARPGIHGDRQPFAERRELPRFAPIVPELGPLGEPQLRPPPPTLLLLDGQPFAERRHEVIVRELVMPLDPRRALFRLVAGRVGRRDQPELGVQDPHQVLEVIGLAAVARRLQQLAVRARMPADLGALVAEQEPEDLARRTLVQPMLRGAAGPANVSSRNATPTPCAPPTAQASPGSRPGPSPSRRTG